MHACMHTYETKEHLAVGLLGTRICTSMHARMHAHTYAHAHACACMHMHVQVGLPGMGMRISVSHQELRALEKDKDH